MYIFHWHSSMIAFCFYQYKNVLDAIGMIIGGGAVVYRFGFVTKKPPGKPGMKCKW